MLKWTRDGQSRKGSFHPQCPTVQPFSAPHIPPNRTAPEDRSLAQHITHWLFLGVALYLAIGLLGTILAASRGEWARARRGIVTLVLVAGVYLGLLVALSLHRPGPVLAPGQSRCFGELCFQVLTVEEPTGFLPRAPNRDAEPLPNLTGLPPDRLVRVLVRITNLDPNRALGEPALSAVLLDQQGRRWEQVPGLTGVPLSSHVQSRGATTSSPVFRVAPDSTGLRLLLRHNGWYSGRFTLDDPESLFHRPEEMLLPPETKSAVPQSARSNLPPPW